MTIPIDRGARCVLTDALARQLAPPRGAEHPALAAHGRAHALRAACGMAAWLIDDALALADERPRLASDLVPYLVAARARLAEAVRPAG